ncbi:hypothetical protein [Paractinoplanes maris]|uniref:hypothetical protein n=1 Tax=Paractinoplanes maris TaxID=1734446 RepID=UPI002020814E|nr:hypothetical protein [Actinoplanes maris]
MPKVKINSDDYRQFEEAAEAAGTTVDHWLAEAGRAQALKAAHGASRVTLPRSDRLTDTWGDALLDLAGELRSTQELAYVTLLQLHTIVNDTALFVAPDAFTRDVVESRLRGQIADALSRRLDRPVDIAVTLARPATHRPEATKASATSQPSQGATQNGKRVAGSTDIRQVGTAGESKREAATSRPTTGAHTDGQLSGVINELEFLKAKVEEYVARSSR